MRSSTIVIALSFVLVSNGVFAQERAAQAPAARAPGAQDPAAQTPPTQDPGQKPPAAVGEEGAKPTRRFLPALFHNLGEDVKHLPRRNTAYFLVGGGALALAVHPSDNKINRRLEGSGAAETFFKPGKVLGNTGFILGASAATYLLGRGKHSGRLQHLGMDGIEAQILTGAIVYGLKETVRRDRPIRADGTQAGGFSFPSGHAASTFAAATVLQQHLGYRAGVPTYLIASYVAMSRLHDNVHKASDVVFGATVGLIVGRTVTWHGRNFYASPMLLPKGGGIIVNVNAAHSLPDTRH
jgi:membrane-associated phospholipid phosphatase